MWLQKDQQFCSAQMVETVNLVIWAITMNLNLKTAKQSSCIILWLMMMHHPTKFGYKRFSSWGDIIQMNIQWDFEPFWPWPQQSYSIFSKDNPAYDDVPSNQLKLQKGDRLSLFWYVPTLWPWPWRQQTNIFLQQSSSHWCNTKPSLVVKGSQFRRYHLDKQLHFEICCDLDLEHNNPISPRDILG